MAEILTQNQIDELLSELSGEKKTGKSNLSSGKIKSYDFRSPKKMSREQYKVLTGITESLARHMAAYFASLHRNACEVAVASIEEHPYSEYNNSLGDTIMTSVIDVSPVNGTILVDMSNSLTFSLIERMLGGSMISPIMPDREFSDIEVALMERIFRRICILMQETVQNIPDYRFTQRQIETNSRFIKAIRIEEVVEVVVFDVTIKDVKGTITACFPYTLVDTMVKDLSKHEEKLETTVQNDEGRKKSLDELGDTKVELRGILGNARLSLNDIVSLQEGDVIRLDQKLGDPVLVTVNGRRWFWGEPGVKKHCKAIRINKYYNGRS